MTFVSLGDGSWGIDFKEREKKRKVKRVSRYKRKWVI